jgi:hypothetical protein
MNDEKKPASFNSFLHPEQLPKVQISKAPPPISPLRGSGSMRSALSPKPNNAHPNWAKWKHMPEVEATQACALALNVDPASMTLGTHGWLAHGVDFPENFPSDEVAGQFKNLMEIAKANNLLTIHFKINLPVFAAWCVPVVRDLTGREIPPELAELAKVETVIESKPSENIYNSKSVCELYESRRNGAVIPWDYWLALQAITPSEAAKLVYCIDPIKWPNDKLGQGLNGDELRIRITRTTKSLSEKNQKWTLSSIVQTLGVDAVPYLMRQAVNQAAPVEQSAPDVKRISVTGQQGDAILAWLKSKNHDPLKLPVAPSGKAGVKKECGDAVCKSMKLFTSRSVFNTAWDRLRANDEIIDAK